MTDHVCGAFDHPKQIGRCLCCGGDCYEIRGVITDGPLAGHPNRVGRMLPDGLQVEFLLSDGTECDITFCVACARNLVPEHYARVWDRVLDRTHLSVTVANRRPVERQLALRQVLAVYPVAILRWRREGAEINSLIVDKRRRQVA